MESAKGDAEAWREQPIFLGKRTCHAFMQAAKHMDGDFPPNRNVWGSPLRAGLDGLLIAFVSESTHTTLKSCL